MQHLFPKVSHDFPLPHVHQGTTLGNACLGLSAWGKGRTLNITVGKQNYADIRAALEAHDMDRIREMFQPDTESVPGMPSRPSLIPLGRISVELDSELERVELNLADGLVSVFLKHSAEPLELRISMKDKGAFAFRSSHLKTVRAVPSYDLAPVLKEISFAEPERFENGFTQPMPADAPYSLSFERDGSTVFCRFRRDEPARPVPAWGELEAENKTYWKTFWDSVTVIRSGNPLLDLCYYLGLFRFQSMTAPDGVPAGLQGPWIEDHNLPPWSSDYHFNINVQMCYWPAYRAGLFDNLKPLFAMIRSWRDTLRSNAKHFVGIDNGYMMPHAVDDHCICMGTFWSGTIDHACAAWMAQMMCEYYDYTGDGEFLRDFAFEFMTGVMNVYLAMLEERGGRLSLPVSVSPEYRGAEINAWGADPSFQLAAIHRLAKDLIRVAGILGKPVDPAWENVRRNLPEATLIEVDGKQQIALWEGVPLEESHRHHSHLAGICPFATLRPDDPKWKDVLDQSALHWIRMGMGRWAGWSMPWAAMLHNRLGNAQMAEVVIEIWHRCFVNPGGGTLHNPQFGGFCSLFGSNEIMQMDAGLGIVAAIQDLFVYALDNELYLMSGCMAEPRREIAVNNLYCPGGFVAELHRSPEDGTEIRLRATRANRLAAHLPVLPHGWTVDGVPFDGNFLSREMKAGEVLVLKSR